jgi:hypothetical protein
VPDISEQRLKHLEFLQNAITRMAGNSMAAKGWSVALTAALVGLAAAENAKPQFVVLAMVAPMLFWAIDGYYMYLEGCYRDRFDDVKNTGNDKWTGFEMVPLTIKRGYFSDGVGRPAVFGIHLPIVVLAFAAWRML